jgi:hypothetical protein
LTAVLKRLVGGRLESFKELGRNLSTRRGEIRF